MGASAPAVLPASSAALARQSPDPATAPIRPSADPAKVEAALRAKFTTGEVLDWTGGNVWLKQPIVIDMTDTPTTAGVDLNGARIVADFNDAETDCSLTTQCSRASAPWRCAPQATEPVSISSVIHRHGDLGSTSHTTMARKKDPPFPQ